jgi:hypothetical protein
MDSVYKRKFYAFLSHASVDKKLVDTIGSWLREAQIPVWYDAHHLPPGAQIVSHLSKAIRECRSMIIVLSKSSISSGWVLEEYEAAIGQRQLSKGAFTIIPIRIDDCDIPEFLETTRRIEIRGEFDFDHAAELLLSLYYPDIDLELRKTRDVYVCRSWHTIPESEFTLANSVCNLFAKAGFRLVGDAEDQEVFGEDRVGSIISSCGGLVAILPDRGKGQTSSFMIEEVELALNLGVPYVIVTESTVELPDLLVQGALTVARISVDNIPNDRIVEETAVPGIRMMTDRWKNPAKPHYIFWGTDLDEEKEERNEVIKRMIERITAMPCVIGDDIRVPQIREAIRNQIANSFMMIADISNDNLNTCIEGGIALGAKVRLNLLAQGARRDPPFMLDNNQLLFYKNDLELLGKIHKIVYPYRRKIINYELAAKNILL